MNCAITNGLIQTVDSSKVYQIAPISLFGKQTRKKGGKLSMDTVDLIL